MTTATVPPEVHAYLAAVRTALADLPAAERDDLLIEVEASLADAAAESGAAVTARLGPPEEFAAELRAAAGLHAPVAPTRPESRIAARLREATARLEAHPAIVSIRPIAVELAPIWWAVRGYLLVAAAALALDTEWSTRLPIVPRVAGSTAWGIATIVVATAASVALGLLQRRRGTPFRGVVVALNVALALAAIPIVQRAMDAMPFVAVAGPAAQPVSGVLNNGAQVDNIYPFSRDGKLLHDVLLYDGAGRPIEISGDRFTDPDRRVVVTNGNEPLWNVFPIRYYEPGTRRVARPNAAPYVEHPLVLTPPLPAPASR